MAVIVNCAHKRAQFCGARQVLCAPGAALAATGAMAVAAVVDAPRLSHHPAGAQANAGRCDPQPAQHPVHSGPGSATLYAKVLKGVLRR
jgi:hypothetical protein